LREGDFMSKPKIKIGSYYEFKLSNDWKIAFTMYQSFENTTIFP